MNWWLKITVFLIAVTLTCASKEINQEDPNVTIVAHAISYGLTNSPITKKSLPFGLVKPYALFQRVGLKFLTLVNVNKPELADEAGEAAEKVYEKLGKLTSELYLRTVGFEVAKFLSSSGLLTNDKVAYFPFMVVTAIELQACSIGANDAESLMNAILLGLYHLFDVLGMASSENITNLFHVFAKELMLQAGMWQ